MAGARLRTLPAAVVPVAVGAAAAVGATSLAVDGMVGTAGFTVGDVLRLAGHGGHLYSVTVAGATASGAQTITVLPALALAMADNTAITCEGAYTSPGAGFAQEYLTKLTEKLTDSTTEKQGGCI